MKQSPLITIVVPVHNRENLVIRTLDSIIAQDCRMAIVVVDNNSTDGSRHVIEEWMKSNRSDSADVTLLSEMKPGAAAARNRGLEAVRTPWVMFFDSDDTMRPGHVARILKGIADNPDADLLGWDALLHRLDGSTRKLRFICGNPITNHLFHASLATQRYAARTSLVRDAGGWDESTRGWDDYVLGLKLLTRRPVMKKLGKQITVDIHEQAESITGLSFSEKRGEWETALDRCEAILEKSDLRRHQRWITARRAIVAGHYTSEGNPCGHTDLENLLSAQKSAYMQWALRRIHNHIARRRRGASLLCRFLLFQSKRTGAEHSAKITS